MPIARQRVFATISDRIQNIRLVIVAREYLNPRVVERTELRDCCRLIVTFNYFAAVASTSTSHSAFTSDCTTTMVEAGRAAPSTLLRTAP